MTGAGAGGWKIAQNAGQTIITKNIDISYGAIWTPHIKNLWTCVASSSDGTKLAAVAETASAIDYVYTSIQSTTAGTSGYITGGQYDSIELQYVGSNTFTVINYGGNLTVY